MSDLKGRIFDILYSEELHSSEAKLNEIERELLADEATLQQRSVLLLFWQDKWTVLFSQGNDRNIIHLDSLDGDHDWRKSGPITYAVKINSYDYQLKLFKVYNRYKIEAELSPIVNGAADSWVSVPIPVSTTRAKRTKSTPHDKHEFQKQIGHGH